MVLRINIGAGKMILEGWENIDQHSNNWGEWIKVNDAKATGTTFVQHVLPSVSIDFETEYFDKYILVVNGKPLPYEDASVDEVLLSHVIEDFLYEFDVVIRDVWRVMKPKAKLTIRVPYGISAGSLHHKKYFDETSFKSLSVENELYRDVGIFSSCKVKVRRLGLVACFFLLLLGKANDETQRSFWNEYGKPGRLKTMVDNLYKFDPKIGKKWEIVAELIK